MINTLNEEGKVMVDLFNVEKWEMDMSKETYPKQKCKICYRAKVQT